MLSRHCRTLYLSLLGLWLLLCGAAGAAASGRDDDGTDRSVVIERLVRHYVVEEDGSYRLMVEDERTVVAPAAVGTHDRYRIDRDPARDEMISVAGWTHKPDGTRIPVAVDGAGVSFAAAAPGDRLMLRYTLRRRAPRLPGQFDDLVLPQALRHRDFRVVYDLPANLILHADAAGFEAMAGDAPPGRRRYGWRYVDGANARVEADAVSQVDDGRRLAVSTLPDHAALAAAMRLALAARPRPPAAVLAQALDSTAGMAADAHGRALALSAWAARTGRDDAGRVVRLTSALAAAGIASTPALVNAGATYTLPDAPTLGVLDHLIVAVPGLGLYLDPATASAGRLPARLLGKPVLLLDTGRFAMTPLLQAGQADTITTVAEALKQLASEQDRHRNYVCPAIDIEDRTMVGTTAGARKQALPRPASIVDGGLFYTSSYAREGDAIVVTRRLSFRHGTPTCTPADHRAMQPALERIRRDLQNGSGGSGSVTALRRRT